MATVSPLRNQKEVQIFQIQTNTYHLVQWILRKVKYIARSAGLPSGLNKTANIYGENFPVYNQV